MNKYDDIIKKLTPLQQRVTQNKGTEPPFDNEYNNEYREGIYIDIVSKIPLFLSSDKYNSGSGWPSFTKPISQNVIVEKPDYTHGMIRTEVKSKEANTHLGHVFPDGPNNGLRYCMNSASLRFVLKEDLEKEGFKEYLKYFIK